MSDEVEGRWFKEFRLAWIKESVDIFGQINRENIIRESLACVPTASVSGLTRRSKLAVA